MGRSAKEEHTAHHYLESPKSPGSHVIPRRFPRLGSQFQTRIPKSTDPLERPLPDLMSAEVPYATEQDVTAYNNDNNHWVNESARDDNTTLSLPSLDVATRRGGTLVHQPVKDNHHFSAFVQPLVTSWNNPPSLSSLHSNGVSSQASWIQHMIHLHSRSEGAGVGASAGTGKRKRAASRGVSGVTKRKRIEEELVWSLENMLEQNRKQQQDSAKRKKKKATKRERDNNNGDARVTCGEEDALAMEYLTQHHEGNIEAAKLMVMASLSGGEAMKMRKCEEKRWVKRRPKTPAVNSSSSWRSVYERVVFPPEDSILGQLQDDSDDSHQKYAVDADNNHCHYRKDSDADNNVDITIETDDLKGAWRSILACGKSIERQLLGELPGDKNKKPLLSTLLTFVGSSYGIPLPETCFGTHHVMIEEVANNMLFILENIQQAQDVQAKIRDKISSESGDGVDSDALLKFLDSECASVPIRLPEVETLYQCRRVVAEWESRLTSLLDTKDESSGDEGTLVSLEEVEHLRDEAKAHGYLSKAVVQLGTRIKRANELRVRILEWKNSFVCGGKGSLKTLGALLKEMNRVKLGFAAAFEIVEFEKASNAWIDRANVAIRSKISYSEIQALIAAANDIPVDLSEYLDKLKTRAQSAEQWLEALETVVPLCQNKLEWLKNLHPSLYNGDQVYLHELSSEGNRIPVDVDEAKILQVALDAKNWTAKSQKWIPTAEESKKAKLEDLRDHLDKVLSFRSRLPLSDSERKEWSPDGEKEVAEIVDAADTWFENYGEFLDGDNRRKEARKSIAIAMLRQIDREASTIYANMGSAATKISKILTQAESWYASYQSLLKRCLVIAPPDGDDTTVRSTVELSELEQSVEDAQSNIPIDIDEALKLKDILDSVDHWRQQVALIAPKRTKRHGKSTRLTLSDLTKLIEESTKLPIDTTDEVNRLQIQLSTIEAWRMQASTELESIVVGFHQLQTHVVSVYGEAGDFSIEFYSKSKDAEEENEDPENAGDADVDMEDSLKVDECGEGALIDGSGSSVEVLRQIKDLQEGAKDISVITEEGELGDLLDSVATWCIRSFKYLHSPRDIFDKRYYGAYDRFLSDGQNLCKKARMQEQDVQENDLRNRMGLAWGKIVSDQLQRLQMLKAERDAFKKWCREANTLLSDEKKMTAEKLSGLAERSRNFPTATDLVSKIRGLSSKINKWTEKTRELLGSGKKLSVQDAQDLLEDGESLKVNSKELKELKAKLTDAENWLNTVSDCINGHTSLSAEAITELVQEHETLLVAMPEEVEELKQAVVGYCLCRRPYEGFMIGCDHCEEWYHGPCVGISESKAGRFEKYACIRCATKDVFESSANGVAGLIRKWTCTRDLKKARQIDYQKIQRKYRKEKKDIEKFTSTISELEHQLSLLHNAQNGIVPTASSVPTLLQTVDDTAVQKSSSAPSTEQPENISTEAVGSQPLTEGSEALSVTTPATVAAGTLPVTVNGIAEASKPAVDVAVNSAQLGTALGQEHSTAETVASGANLQVSTSNGDVTQTSSSPVEKEGEAGQGQSEVDSLPKIDKSQILSQLDKTKSALEQAKERLEVISVQSREQKRLESRENDHAMLLRRWVLRVRGHVLVPSEASTAEAARPPFGVFVTQQMKDVMEDASQLGIDDMPDTKKMLNFFQSMCWGLTALALIRRKPSITEINYLIAVADGMKLPDERALRTMKYMTNRGNQWQLKIEKVLAPKPDETKPIPMSSLTEIVDGIQELPLIVPELRLVQAAIEDKGKRHCICGGPNDGKKMLCCDKCKKWFHGSCMNESSAATDDEPESWLCPSCGGKEITETFAIKVKSDETVTVPKEPSPCDASFVSPHAPDPKQLWPPFGLLGSKPAIEALGLECSAIPEETVVAQPGPQQSQFAVQQHTVSTITANLPTANPSQKAFGFSGLESQGNASVLGQDATSSYASLSAQLAANGAASAHGQQPSPALPEVSSASVDAKSNSSPMQQAIGPVNNMFVPAGGITKPVLATEQSVESGHSSGINGNVQTVLENASETLPEIAKMKNGRNDTSVPISAVTERGESVMCADQAFKSTVKSHENSVSTTNLETAEQTNKRSSDSIVEFGDTCMPHSTSELSDTMQVKESGVAVDAGAISTSQKIASDANVPAGGSDDMQTQDIVPAPADQANDMDIDAPAVQQAQQQQPQQPPSTSPPQCHGSDFENLAQVVTADAPPVTEAST